MVMEMFYYNMYNFKNVWPSILTNVSRTIVFKLMCSIVLFNSLNNGTLDGWLPSSQKCTGSCFKIGRQLDAVLTLSYYCTDSISATHAGRSASLEHMSRISAENMRANENELFLNLSFHK